MMRFAEPLQKWVFEQLTMPAIEGVVQVIDHACHVSRDGNLNQPDFPYVEIADSDFVADDADYAPGGTHSIDLHIWSRAKGQREVKMIMGEVYDRLHRQYPSIDGLETCLSRIGATRILNDPDGNTRHGVVTVQILTRTLENADG